MIFQFIAIVILLVFYGCYLMKMFSQKKKGIRTDQMGRGKTGFVKFVEMATKAAAILVIAMELASIFIEASHSLLPLRLLGATISLAGTIVFITAVLTMRDSWRAGVPETDKTELITKGIYQFSRNPAFLGFDLLHMGILLMFFNWILFAATVFAILMYHLQIVNVEEPFLLTAFGEEYLQYRKKVRRYISLPLFKRNAENALSKGE